MSFLHIVLRNFDWRVGTHQHNLIKRSFSSCSLHVKLRSVVADELLRVRMDTKMSLISEIREKVVIIGQELILYHLMHISTTTNDEFIATT